MCHRSECLMVELNSCVDSLLEDYRDQVDKHILALLVLQYSGSDSGRHTALCLELTSSHCNFWAVCNLTGFESGSAAGLMYPCSLTFCCTHCAERKPLFYSSVLSSCSLSYNKSSVLEAVSKKNVLSLSSGVNIILYGHRQNDVRTVWARALRLTQSVKPLLFPSSIIGITRVLIIHASVQCVLPAAY